MHYASHCGADLARRGRSQVFVKDGAEDGERRVDLTALARGNLKNTQTRRLTQHHTKKRDWRAFLSKGAAEIDTQIEKLAARLQPIARLGMKTLDDGARHLR